MLGFMEKFYENHRVILVKSWQKNNALIITYKERDFFRDKCLSYKKMFFYVFFSVLLKNMIIT